MPASVRSTRTATRTHPRPGAIAALGLFALAVLAGCSSGVDARPTARTAASKASDRTVTVTATGTSKGVPDALLVSLTVTSRGASASEVIADNNRRTQKVLDQLKITAVDDKDVSTTEIDLGPTYDKKGNISGYVANNSLRITFRSLESAGAKLDALVRGGDDHVRIGGVQLGFTDDDELVSTARIDAVKRAKAQAKEMAEAAGADLSEVRTIADVVPEGSYPQAFVASGRGSADTSIPIAPGSQELSVQVKVVFDLR